jgi:hypothetical protein
MRRSLYRNWRTRGAALSTSGLTLNPGKLKPNSTHAQNHEAKLQTFVNSVVEKVMEEHGIIKPREPEEKDINKAEHLGLPPLPNRRMRARCPKRGQ